jgi:hypothetical protein
VRVLTLYNNVCTSFCADMTGYLCSSLLQYQAVPTSICTAFGCNLDACWFDWVGTILPENTLDVASTRLLQAVLTSNEPGTEVMVCCCHSILHHLICLCTDGDTVQSLLCHTALLEGMADLRGM